VAASKSERGQINITLNKAHTRFVQVHYFQRQQPLFHSFVQSLSEVNNTKGETKWQVSCRSPLTQKTKLFIIKEIFW